MAEEKQRRELRADSESGLSPWAMAMPLPQALVPPMLSDCDVV